MFTKIISMAVLTVLSCGIALAGGVTNVKEIVNNTRMVVEVRKYDTKPGAAAPEFETTREIPANGGVWTGDMWVPWVDNANDFTEKRMELRVYRGTAFWIWQSGEYLRFNDRGRFLPNARRVAGESRSGGDRRMIISMTRDGRLAFDFQSL